MSSRAPGDRPEDPAWYTPRWELALEVAAAVTYVGLGMFHKWLLNWIIGPLWLLAWVWLVPALLDRVVGLRRPRERSP